ncbi:MAG TPA: Stf0 family sulfotransferase [Myxococcota bacterium]|nr:Stf0 family sulfotransferase [Myxococcota bacterium]
MRPVLSYTIWFSQRTGSTLLCHALESTGLAGRPGEWLLSEDVPALYTRHGARTPTELRARIWDAATTPNGVLGLKHGIYQPYFSAILDEFCQLDGHDGTRPGMWENAFPNSRHIFMTRRNRVRLAVSWWKAIQSQEWHRLHGTPSQDGDIADRYNFEAIDHLLAESALREAATQEFFAEGEIVPLTIVYEDFVRRYEQTVFEILTWLGIPASAAVVAPPAYERLADAVSEAWVQRFRHEKQARWKQYAW